MYRVVVVHGERAVVFHENGTTEISSGSQSESEYMCVKGRNLEIFCFGAVLVLHWWPKANLTPICRQLHLSRHDDKIFATLSATISNHTCDMKRDTNSLTTRF